MESDFSSNEKIKDRCREKFIATVSLVLPETFSSFQTDSLLFLIINYSSTLLPFLSSIHFYSSLVHWKNRILSGIFSKVPISSFRCKSDPA